MNTRIRFFSLSFLLLFLTNLSTGSDVVQHEDMQTPQRATLVLTVDETPGVRLSREQAQVYKEDRFIDVLGDDFHALLETIHENKEEALRMFRLFQDTRISYADHRKSFVARMVKRFNEKYKKTKTDAHIRLFYEVLQLDETKRTLPLNRIEESTVEFFERMYPACCVKLTYKLNGVQLGTIAKVQTAAGKEFEYYVKTHSGGLISANSASAKLMSSPELMVYKTLELLGVGCESHFFGRDGQNMYIATLSANTDGEFKEYSHFTKSNSAAVVCGGLADIPTERELDHAKIEVSIKANRTSQVFVREMSKLDLLARILRLTDFQTNRDNYGFVRLSNGDLKIKALDFRLISTEPEELMFGDHFFTAFINGNGLYHYPTADEAMCYVLRYRQKDLRIQEARAIVEQELAPFESVVDDAMQIVTLSLSEINMTENEKDKTQTDLMQYAKIIKQNFRRFKDSLEGFVSEE